MLVVGSLALLYVTHITVRPAMKLMDGEAYDELMEACARSVCSPPIGEIEKYNVW